VDLQLVEPDPQAGRWRFSQPFEGCATLLDLYRRSGAPAGTRATVPALYGRSAQTIVLSESARLIELLNAWPQAKGPDLAPETHRVAIEAWRQRLQGEVNDGVYRCGFARTQAAYDEAEAALFQCLQDADHSLAVAEAHPAPGSEGGEGPWLAGTPQPSLADVVLFPTLIRFETVYAPLFGCSGRPLWQFPALWRWRSRFYGLPGVAATCASEHWRRDYFGSLFPLHPSGIVPAGPDLSTLVLAQPPALP
jgi:putative glutathione S-transferase